MEDTIIRRITIALCALVCFISFIDQSCAAPPVVGRGSGVVAVQTVANGEWLTVPIGGILPDKAEARTAAMQPAYLHSDHGVIAIWPLSQIMYDVNSRRVYPMVGRCFCSAEGTESWRMIVGAKEVEVPGGSGVEVSAEPEGVWTVTVLRGTAVVRVPQANAVTVAERTSRTWHAHQPAAKAESLSADDERWLAKWTAVPPPGQGVGQLMIKDAQGNSRMRLNIARYHAELVLQPPVALIKLDQTFYNPSKQQEEGEFIFNLPPGASVSRFAMFVTPTQMIEGEVIDRNRANQIYSSIVYARRDPAILEQIGDNLFKMRVFPIFPKDVKRILLDFTLPLEGRRGQYQLQLPLLSDLKPIWDFRLFGSIRGAMPFASVKSLTFPELKFVQHGAEEIGFEFARQNFQPTSDFQVAFQQPVANQTATFRRLVAEPLNVPEEENGRQDAAHFDETGAIRAGFDEWNKTPATYFLADLPLPETAADTGPADVAVLLDTSANGTLDDIRPALQTVLASLRDDDRFRLACVDVVTRPLRMAWHTPRTPAAENAYRDFEQEFCLGGTDMIQACQSVEPLFAERQAERRRIVIYIGDGIDSVHRQDRDVTAKACAAAIQPTGATFFAINTRAPEVDTKRWRDPRWSRGGGFFQFGPSSFDFIEPNGTVDSLDTRKPRSNGRALLHQIADSTGGTSFDLGVGATEEARLFEWLLAGFPRPTFVTELKVANADPRDIYFPATVLPGEPLRVAGRIKPDQVLKFNWVTRGPGGKTQQHELQPQPAANSTDYLAGRYWADQRLQRLQQMLPMEKENRSNSDVFTRAMIVQLSREWSILTPQTAYLVLEKEADYLSWGVPRQARRPYWSKEALPAIPPLPANWLAMIMERRSNPQQPDAQSITPQFVQEQLSAARRAIQANRYDRALLALDQLRGHPQTEASQAYQSMRRLAEQWRQDSRAMQSLGVKQAWFDTEMFTRPLPRGVDRLFTPVPVATDYLLQRHPLADVLLQEIDLPEKTMTLHEFATFLRQTLGVNVDIDRSKLEEESVSVDAPLRVMKLDRISALQAIQRVLDQHNLTFYEYPDRLAITTKTEASWKRQRAAFPVRDIVSNRPQFEYEDLIDPIADREEAVAQRIAEKLNHPMTWKLEDGCLLDVAERLRKELNENVIIETNKLEEESVTVDALDVTFDYEKLPVREVLKAILNNKNLTYRLDGEVLTITTKTEGIAKRPMQFYSVSDLLFRDSHRPNRMIRRPRVRQPEWLWMPGMGFGGMMGGGMGGMGGGAFGGGAGPGRGDAPAGGGFGINLPTPPVGLSDQDPDSSNLPVDADGNVIVAHPNWNRPNLRRVPAADVETDTGDLRNVDHFPTDSAASELMDTILQQTGGPPDSPWLGADGEGGLVEFFGPGMSLIIRQTNQTHEEIAELLKKLRDAQKKRGHRPDMMPVTPAEMQPSEDSDDNAAWLAALIEDLIGGPPDAPWMNADGEGGSVSYDKPRYLLNIVQNPYILDEINALLVRLRRERYSQLQRGRAWSLELLTTAQPGLIDGPWQRARPQQPAVPGKASPESLAALQVRREVTSGTWEWNDSQQGQPTRFALQTVADRLRMQWPGWEFRTQGLQASASLPRLQYAELGDWGTALREWLDVQIVFWPHRSNQELAAMFEVSTIPPAKSADANQVRLKFVPANLDQQQVSIEIVYNKSTGLPVLWEAFQKSQVVQRYRIETQSTAGQPVRLTVQRENGAGKFLGNGVWVSDLQPAGNIPAPHEFPPETIVVDRRPITRENLTAFERGLQHFRQLQYRPALKEFQTAHEQYPNHPLVGFLWAWTLDNQTTDVSNDQVKQAYAAVVPLTPPEVLLSLNRRGSRHLHHRELYEVLRPRLQQSDKFQDQLFLARLALQDGSPGETLVHALAAWKLQPQLEADQFENLHMLIESSLRTGDFKSALEYFDAWTGQTARNPAQLSELLRLFGGYGHSRDMVIRYQEVLKRSDKDLATPLRRSLLKQMADAQQGIDRWETLLRAAELLPATSKQGIVEIYLLLGELTNAHDPALASKLASQAKHPSNRQRLQVLQAELSPDIKQSQELFWKLHEEGYVYHDRLSLVCDRFNESGFPERTLAVMKPALHTKRLTRSERLRLATAYELLNRHDEVARALTTE